MKKIVPINFKDVVKLSPAEMNSIHLETGLHSDSVSDHQRQRRQP